LGISLTFLACEKVIELVPESLPPRIVVEGSIENGQPPIVFLTKSLAFFNTLTPEMLRASFVRNARISVNDGIRTVTLREYPVPFGDGQVYFYSIDTANPAGFMIGQFNRTYQLNIESEGQTYQSTTTIPALEKRFDSLWWQPAPNNPDTNRVVVFARVFDPPGLGNYIRYFTSRNDSAFIPGFNSVFDDDIVDGLTYNIQVFRGQNRNEPFDNEEFGFFRRGNKVQVKLSNIDRATFDFWRTWEQNQSNVGNPFSVPIKVLSNISNGGAGIWGGYASQIGVLEIPE
jgi:hypothetical protein